MSPLDLLSLRQTLSYHPLLCSLLQHGFGKKLFLLHLQFFCFLGCLPSKAVFTVHHHTTLYVFLSRSLVTSMRKNHLEWSFFSLPLSQPAGRTCHLPLETLMYYCLSLSPFLMSPHLPELYTLQCPSTQTSVSVVDLSSYLSMSPKI